MPKIWKRFIRAVASPYTIGFTAIMQKASKVFEDEASLSNTATVSCCWLKRGEQPRICQPQRRKERCIIFGCARSDTGKLITDVVEKGNIVTFFRFLFSVVQHYNDKKVYMILDNVRFHHAKRLDRILKDMYTG